MPLPRRALALAVVVLALSVPAPSAGAAAAGEPNVVDEEGDARWRGTREARATAAGDACSAAWAVTWPACIVAYSRVSADTPAGSLDGVPAPPELDLLSATFSEVPGALDVDLELARVDDSLAAGVPEDGDAAYVMVCWSGDGAACAGRVLLMVTNVKGLVVMHAQFDRSGTGCSDWNWCAWDVPFTLEPGSPGHVRWRVPVDLLTDDELARGLPDPSMWVYRSVGGHEARQSYSVYGTPLTGATGGEQPYYVDGASGGDSYRFQGTARAVTGTVAGGDVSHVDAVGDVPGPASRPDVDVLRVDVRETPGALTFATQVARVDVVPDDHELYLGFGLPDGRVVNAWVDSVGGNRDAGAGRYADAESTRWLSVPVSLHVVPGAPGWVNLTFARTDLDSPGAGHMLPVAFATMYLSDSQSMGTDQASLGHYWEVTAYDWSTPLPAFRFRHDTARLPEAPPAGAEDAAAVVEDDAGDAALPALARGTEASGSARFDVTFAAATPDAPGVSRLALGIRDLDRAKPPSGYEAVVYAVALETTQGRFLAGLYKTANDQRFICAPDTLVFADADENRLDPTGTFYVEVPGVVTYGTSVTQTGAPASAGAGSITWEFPHAQCLNRADTGPVEVLRMRAGTFLVRNDADDALPAGVERVDDTRLDEPFVLETASLATASTVRAPWYSSPFGVENFWDMLGIAAAVITSSVSLAVVRRQRGVLKRYLSEIDEAVDGRTQDPSAREGALVDVRSRLKRDFIRGAIREAHYVLVEQRLDEELAKARLDGLGEAFQDLPHRLLARLQSMLADGQLSPEDFNLFCAHLDDAPLTEDAKARVRRKLQMWVAEDASAMSTMRG